MLITARPWIQETTSLDTEKENVVLRREVESENKGLIFKLFL